MEGGEHTRHTQTHRKEEMMWREVNKQVTLRHRKEEVMWREVNKQVTLRHTVRKEERMWSEVKNESLSDTQKEGSHVEGGEQTSHSQTHRKKEVMWGR